MSWTNLQTFRCDIRVHREFCQKGSLANIQGKSLDQTEDEVDMSAASEDGARTDICTTGPWPAGGEVLFRKSEAHVGPYEVQY
ncbi:hypothetical protein MHYP_G00363550 [Metynnis hypsauchen]